VGYVPREYVIGFAAALFGSIVEAMPLAVDDNLSITFSVGCIMWLMYAMFLPAINVFALDLPG
jgi:dolichol kinase